MSSAWGTEVTLAWNPPEQSIDGCCIDDVCGYKVVYGTSSGVYTSMVMVDGTPQATISGLKKGMTYYFAVKACTTCQCESTVSEEIMWTVPVMEDQDHDKLPDQWETSYFDSLDDAQGAASDFDNDGFSDYEEYIAGTLPNQADDFPRLTINKTSSQITVGFQSVIADGDGYENRARYYTLLRCDSLTSSDWQVVPSYEAIPANDEYLHCAISCGTDTGFYRTLIHLD
jgi:hypothetical protein